MKFASLALAGTLLSSLASAQLPPPPVPPENPLSEAKRVLGKALFWDEQLSSDDTIACGSCHIPSAGGGDPRSGAQVLHPGPDGILGTRDDRHGSAGVVRQDAGQDFAPSDLFRFSAQVTPRASGTNIGAAYFDELFWDGRASGEFVDPETGVRLIASGGALESQALGPILSSTEMAHEGRTWSDVRAKLERAEPLALAFALPADLRLALVGVEAYPKLFERAFGDPGVSAARIAFAIATYERTLVPDQTPWDLYMKGDLDAMTDNQRTGFDAFWDFQARCIACHMPPLFADGSYRNLGRRPIAEDPGRSAVTSRAEDRGRFKVPSLRNAGLRPTQFHDGTTSGVLEAVRFYNAGVTHPDNVDAEIPQIAIPPELVRHLADFVQNALTDPRVAAELPPFDRPQLNSERAQPNPELLPGGTPGSGGITPRMIATSPPHIGSGSFKLGLCEALGGSQAWLTVALQPPPAVGWTRVASLALAGSGAGDGYATLHLALPLDPTLIGLESWLQFRVRDPAASGGFARSPIAHITLF